MKNNIFFTSNLQENQKISKNLNKNIKAVKSNFEINDLINTEKNEISGQNNVFHNSKANLIIKKQDFYVENSNILLNNKTNNKNIEKNNKLIEKSLPPNNKINEKKTLIQKIYNLKKKLIDIKEKQNKIKYEDFLFYGKIKESTKYFKSHKYTILNIFFYIVFIIIITIICYNIFEIYDIFINLYNRLINYFIVKNINTNFGNVSIKTNDENNFDNSIFYLNKADKCIIKNHIDLNNSKNFTSKEENFLSEKQYLYEFNNYLISFNFNLFFIFLLILLIPCFLYLLVPCFLYFHYYSDYYF